jgi:hypothetical protein
MRPWRDVLRVPAWRAADHGECCAAHLTAGSDLLDTKGNGGGARATLPGVATPGGRRPFSSTGTSHRVQAKGKTRRSSETPDRVLRAPPASRPERVQASRPRQAREHRDDVAALPPHAGREAGGSPPAGWASGGRHAITCHRPDFLQLYVRSRSVKSRAVPCRSAVEGHTWGTRLSSETTGVPSILSATEWKNHGRAWTPQTRPLRFVQPPPSTPSVRTTRS